MDREMLAKPLESLVMLTLTLVLFIFALVLFTLALVLFGFALVLLTSSLAASICIFQGQTR